MCFYAEAFKTAPAAEMVAPLVPLVLYDGAQSSERKEEK